MMVAALKSPGFRLVEDIIRAANDARPCGVAAGVWNVVRVTDDEIWTHYDDPHPDVWDVDAALRGRKRHRLLSVLRELDSYEPIAGLDLSRTGHEVLAAALTHRRSPFGIEVRAAGQVRLWHRGVTTVEPLKQGNENR